MNSMNNPKEQSAIQASTNMALALALRNQNQRPQKKKKNKGPPLVKNNKNNQKRKNRVNPKQFNQMFKTKTPECTLMYASALADPEFTPVGACVPFGFPIPSQKVKSFTRGTFQLGTTGDGFVCASPVLANNVDCTVTSSVTSVGTQVSIPSAFTNKVTGTLPRLPYSSAQLADVQNTLAGRFVSAALKCRYAGTEAARNGIVTSLEEPNFKDLMAVPMSNQHFYNNALVERPKPDGSWHTVKFSGPTLSALTQFSSSSWPGNSGSAIANLFIGIKGVAGDLYEYEYYQHTEYEGSITTGVTPSHVDSSGFAKVVEVFKSLTANTPLNDRNAKSTFYETMSSLGTSAGRMVLDYGAQALAGMISPALIPFARGGTQLLLGN